MQEFTVSLPTYNTIIPFDRETFATMFPNSLITVTLHMCKGNDVPLENPSVTPYVLQLLKDICITGRYTAVDTEYKKAFDYLNIDLPEPVYYPQYTELLENTPDFNINDFKDYRMYLRIAEGLKFPELAKYLFDHTDPVAHRQEDYNEFMHCTEPSMIPRDPSKITIMLLTKRQVLQSVPSHPIFVHSIMINLDPNLFEAYLKLVPGSAETYSLTDQILNRMMTSPLDYLRYYNMLTVLGPYFTTVTPVNLVARLQRSLYDLIQAVTVGDQKTVNTFLDDPIPGLIDEYTPVVAYTALIRREYAIAQDAFQREAQYLKENWNDMLYGQWIYRLEDAYLGDPKWITEEGFQVFVNGMNSIAHTSPTPDDYIQYIHRKFSRRKDLGQFISQLPLTS